jgi:hypothetical protein
VEDILRGFKNRVAVEEKGKEATGERAKCVLLTEQEDETFVL